MLSRPLLRAHARLCPTSGPTRRLSNVAASDLLKNVGKITSGMARTAGDDTMIVRGRGSYVEMHDGRQLLDFTTGIGVTGLGHVHPKVSQAAAAQCMEIVHAQCSIAAHPQYLALIEKLSAHVPHPSLEKFFFSSAGTEAVEAAIKIARMATKKQNIIAMQGAYHGRTYGAMAITSSKTGYAAGAMPLMPGAVVTQFPYWRHFAGELGKPTASPEELSKAALQSLEILLKQQTAPSDTAAIIIEPILGEGGYIAAPKEFLVGLREICDKHDILLIIDEVQSGFGRSGDFWAIQESGVRPDILLTAKGLANGFPLSGVITTKAVNDKCPVGSMGGTYAGNAVSCAAANAVIDAIAEENILENVRARSSQLFSFLNGLKSDSTLGSHILDIRGRGLMVGIEFSGAGGGLAAKIAKRCIEKGMLLLTTSSFDVIRFIPPLNVTEADMAKGLGMFEQALREVVSEVA